MSRGTILLLVFCAAIIAVLAIAPEGCGDLSEQECAEFYAP